MKWKTLFEDSCLQAAAVSEDYMTSRRGKWALWLIACVGFVACLTIAIPIMRSIYMQQRLKSFVKITTVYPKCPESIAGRNPVSCNCEFIFDGVTDVERISFSGPGLEHSYDSQNRTVSVRGTGNISSESNSIQILKDSIVVNSTVIPANRPSSFHILIKPDGRLVGSRWDLHW